MCEEALERSRDLRGAERLDEEARVPDLPSSAAAHETPELFVLRPASPRGLLLQRPEGTEIALLLNDPQDGFDSERSDQFVLEVGVTHIEPVWERALERARLADVAKARDGHIRPEAPDEATNGVRTADRDDRDAFRAEVTPAPCRKRLDRHLVTRPLDEDDGLRINAHDHRR
jgi:hypothetical protein